MSVKNIMMAAAGTTPSVVSAEAIDFDGVNDRLTRSTDFTGNTDGKTFTFSAWIWYPIESAAQYVFTSGQGFEVTVRSTSNGSYIQILGRNAAGGDVLVTSIQSTANPSVNSNTFYHLLVSIDMTNTANRFVYINDVNVTPTWTVYSNTNGNIDFTLSADNISVGEARNGGNLYKGRLSNLFLDYTYRDLSVTANRRLFVTADLKPAAGQAALNPIMYLPMSDPTQPGLNKGTGGNLTLTGTVARSGRGPNQFNVPFSTFNGSSQYARRTVALVGATDTRTITVFCSISTTNLNSGGVVFDVNNGSTTLIALRFTGGGAASNALRVVGKDSGATTLLDATTNLKPVASRNYLVLLSIDLSSTSKRSIYINGVLDSTTWTTYTNGNLRWAGSGSDIATELGSTNSGNIMPPGNLGGLWVNNSYIDLSVQSNREKFVSGTGIDAKPVDLGANGELPTGTSPLIYLPMYGNNAGKNYGTGGDFTVNSGPYTGARGPNEFWGNYMSIANSTTGNMLQRTSALSGVSDGKTFSCVFTAQQNVENAGYSGVFTIASANNERLFIGVTNDISTSYKMIVEVRLYNSSGTLIGSGYGQTPSIANYTYYICVDMSSANLCKILCTDPTTGTTSTVVSSFGSFSAGSNINMSGSEVLVGARTLDSANRYSFSGKIAEFYFSTSYIDFTQEANRLKFRDAFGNPVNLTQQIEAAATPNPAIYMRFDPAAQGMNSGTGGNFIKTGTITDGGQF